MVLKSYKEYLHQINTFIFDVDGVLTNGMVTITTSGEMIRHMNVKDGYAIKQPVFSFNKFPDVNKQLGPEMKSTGESILFIDDLNDDSFFELYSRRKMYLTK